MEVLGQRRLRAAATAALVPIAYAAVALHFSYRGEALYVARDPGLCYFLNSYGVAMGEAAHFADHPGATVQALGALALRALKGFAPMSRPDAFAGHLFYTHFLGRFAIALNACLLTLAGFLARRRAGMFTIVTTQLFFFVSPAAIDFWGLYQPEALLISGGSLLWISFLLRRRWRALIAFLLGSAVATKLTFLGYPAAVLARARGRAWLLAGAAATFVAWVLLLLPKWEHMIRFVIVGAVYSGSYGDGPPGFRPWASYQALFVNNFWLRGADELRVVLAFFAIAAIGFARRGPARARRELAAALVAFAIGALIFLRKATGLPYLLPSFATLPACAFALALVTRKSRLRFAAPALLAFLLGTNGRDGFTQLQLVENASRSVRSAAADLRATLARHEQCLTLSFGPVPLEADALDTGGAIAAPDWRRAVREAYPRFFALSPAFTLPSSTGEPEPAADWVRERKVGCVNLVTLPGLAEEVFRHVPWRRNVREKIDDTAYYRWYLLEL